MNEQCIISAHVRKLGHNLQEIRERALNNIISKLDHGFLYDNDLARSKELLTKLVEWFTFNSFAHEEKVLKLVQRILKTESGKVIANHIGVDVLINDVKEVRAKVHPKYHPIIDDILVDITTLPTLGVSVPPLLTTVPLSYRSDQGDYVRNAQTVGSTATPIVGQIYEPSFSNTVRGAQNGYETYRKSKPRTIAASPIEACLPNMLLAWQPLVTPDVHVLKSVEESLRNPTEPSNRLNSCEFFSDVMLQDYPPEVFLQQPSIVHLLFNLLNNCASSKLQCSVLNCFDKLSSSLLVRIKFYNDPCTQNLKQHKCTIYTTEAGALNNPPNSVRSKTSVSSNCTNNDICEDVAMLRLNQLTLPHFSIKLLNCTLDFISRKSESLKESIRRATNQAALNTALAVLDNGTLMLSACINSAIFDNVDNSLTNGIVEKLSIFFAKLGDSLEHFRLSVAASDIEHSVRSVHLILLHLTNRLLRQLVPLRKADLILPDSLKSALSNVPLDIPLALLYSDVHECLLSYVEVFTGRNEIGFFGKYKHIKSVNSSMTAAVKFLKHHESMPLQENLQLAKESLISLDFHRNFTFIHLYVELCTNKLPHCQLDDQNWDAVNDITLAILAHADEEIRTEMYKLCHKKVKIVFGSPRINISNNINSKHLLFLLQSSVLLEIIVHGVTSTTIPIQTLSEEMLILILKSKSLVPECIWNNIITAFLPTLPLLLCHADKSTPLGRMLVSIFDPDTATSLGLSQIEILKGNLRLLFSPDTLTREESLSRLCWLLATEPNAHELMPRLSSLQHNAINAICLLRKQIDLKQSHKTQHFYQPSSLVRVLELLNGSNVVEPPIRRSALTQISVMMEDSLLHSSFLEHDGLGVLLRIMRSALKENDYNDYPDSMIPIVAVLKNLCLFNPPVRQELALNVDIFYCVLRSVMIFCTEDRMKQDGAVLMFVLLYSDFTIGTPSHGGISLPDLIVKKINSPFISQVHWKTSRHSKPGLCGVLQSDEFCKNAIRLHFYTEWFGGYDEIINWNLQHIKDSVEWTNFNVYLKLQENDLLPLKSSCIRYCCQRYLHNIQNASSHRTVSESVLKILGYIQLYNLTNNTDYDSILSLPWEATLVRFFLVPPAGDSDIVLLSTVVKFLTYLVVLYRKSSHDCWIINTLKQSNHCIYDFLTDEQPNITVTASSPDMKILRQHLFALITKCVTVEQQRTEYKNDKSSIGSSWCHVVKTIQTALECNETQHFYNLAYLDCMLSCLVNVTANLGWSNSKSQHAPQKILSELIQKLCEFIGAFHCGKGPSAATSLMGLSITRNSLLILNHILSEMQFCNVKHWETCWMDFDDDTNDCLSQLCCLWLSRDVVVRAAILQLFAGIAVSLSGATKLVEIVLDGNSGVWEAALIVVIDHGEASVVREQAASLLTNLINHIGSLETDSSRGYASLLPIKYRQCPEVQKLPTNVIMLLLDEYNFFKELTTILLCLSTENCVQSHSQSDVQQIDYKVLDENVPTLPLRDEYMFKYTKSLGGGTTVRSVSASNSTDDSVRNDEFLIITTPGLVKSVTKLVLNLMHLAPDRIVAVLQEHNLIKDFFRCLRTPTSVLTNTNSNFTLYCDVLEMSEGICELLNRSAQISATCSGILLRSRNCLNTLVTVLNTDTYYSRLPQLLYLRNKLWSEAFNLLGTLVASKDCGSDIVAMVFKDCGHQTFLETICEAISSNCSSDLQHSAISSLTSLLRLEYVEIGSGRGTTTGSRSLSMQNLLDHSKTPRSNSQRSDEENIDPCGKGPRLNVGDLMVGAELCKILMYLYDLCNVEGCSKKKMLVVNALTCILCVSHEAKLYALSEGFAVLVTNELKEIHIRLSLESADSLRRVNDRKRVCPLLKDVNCLMGLLTNFMLGNVDVKETLVVLGLADSVHKFWIWCCLQKPLLEDALKMLCTFTTNCLPACQSLTLTSSVAGSGPRKSPSNFTLIHAVCLMITKEMELISRTHDMTIIELCFQLLHNSCCSLECRIVLSKCNLLASLNRLHPAITKRQKPWEIVEFLWLEFLQSYTGHLEGQATLSKSSDALEIITTLTNSPKLTNRTAALKVLRNIAFHLPNRPRLLASGEFLNVLQTKLIAGNLDEKKMVISIMWALAANNQKAKLILKCSGLDSRLQDVMRQYQLKADANLNSKDLQMMHYVHSLFNDDEKCI